MDVEKILAGRKAVEEYREAHAKLHEVESDVYDHGPLIAQLTAKLKELGYSSLEDLVKASNQANLEVLASSVVRMNYCDSCPGKERACVPSCNDRGLESWKYSDAALAESRAKRLIHSIHWWHEHWVPHLPLRLGDTFPMLPGCNVIMKVVKEPELDWTYRVDDSLPWGDEV